MKVSPNDPIATWSNSVQLAALLVQAQSAVAGRIWAMAGLWTNSRGENQRVLSEAVYALNTAARDATAVSMTGASPEAILTAAIKPLKQTSQVQR